jgi:periplasmic protein TonB
MSEADDKHELSLTPFDTRPVGATVVHANRQFNIALVVATVVHVLFLTSFISAEVRRLGDPSGARDGISVDIVTEADLRRMATVADKAPGTPAPPSEPPPPPQQQTASLPPAPPTPPEPQTQQKAEPPPPEPRAATPQEPTPPSPPEPKAQPKSAPPDRAIEQLLKIPAPAALPHSLDPPKPPEPVKPAEPAKPAEARRSQPKQRQLRTTALDLTLPPALFTAPSGSGGAGVERPPGITRSGENDAFARGVIAALQRTMPQLRDTRGRVTVRLKLDKDGGLVSTEVMRPSSVAGLDQNVVFATRQASFPFPPRNANSADLTFLITYIYR